MFAVNSALLIIAISTLGLLLPDISNELSLSPSQQGWLASSVLIAYLVFEIPIGWGLSRFRPWRVSTLSFFAGGLLVASLAWSPTYAILLLSRVGLGVFIIATRTTRVLLVHQWIHRKNISIANGISFGLFEALDGTGSILMPFILAWMGDWRMSLYLWAVICLVSAFLWASVGKDRPHSTEARRAMAYGDSPIRSLFRYKEVWILGFGISGAIASESAFTAFWPTFTSGRYGTALTSAGLILGLMFMARAPSILVVSSLSFIVRRTPLLLILSSITLCTSYLGLVFVSQLPLLILFGTLNGLSYCFMPAVTTAVFRLPGIKAREVAVAVAMVSTLQWSGASIGPLLVGFVQESTDSLKLGMVIASLTPLLMIIAGITLILFRTWGTDRNRG